MAITHTHPAIQEWHTRLRDEGVLPPDVRRIIIDIPLEGCVTVYYECLGDKRMFSIALANALVGADVISVSKWRPPNGRSG